MKLSRDDMLEAMKRGNRRYDGVFFVGVKTTKMYCLPSCKAKLPLPENVVFFFHEEAALSCHYRPCKRCKPDLYPNVSPLWIDDCVSFLRENANRRVRDSELTEIAAVEVSTLRRAFTVALGMTPVAYHRGLRLEQAAGSLRRNNPVVQVSEEIGFESLSGFVDAFRRKFSVSPGRYASR